jgi:hypothetical protein
MTTGNPHWDRLLRGIVCEMPDEDLDALHLYLFDLGQEGKELLGRIRSEPVQGSMGRVQMVWLTTDK